MAKEQQRVSALLLILAQCLGCVPLCACSICRAMDAAPIETNPHFWPPWRRGSFGSIFEHSCCRAGGSWRWWEQEITAYDELRVLCWWKRLNVGWTLAVWWAQSAALSLRGMEENHCEILEAFRFTLQEASGSVHLLWQKCRNQKGKMERSFQVAKWQLHHWPLSGPVLGVKAQL